MKSIVSSAPTPDDLKKYGLDKPKAIVNLHMGSARASLAIGGPADETTVYAKDLSRPDVYTIDKTTADDFTKTADDFRRKELFDMRAFTATRIEITRDGKTTVFEKVKGTGENAQDTWKRVSPTAAEPDKEKFQTFVASLADIRAISFVDSKAKTGLDAPAVTIVVKFDEGKKEDRVTAGEEWRRCVRLAPGRPWCRQDRPDQAGRGAQGHRRVRKMTGRLTAAVLSLTLLLACRGTPAPALPSRPSPEDARSASVATLRQRVATLLADQAVSAGTWGVEVRSLRGSDTLIAENAHRLLTPASTLKVITLAVAADQLGWDYTFETRVVPHGTIVNGTLEGDLVVIGSGDPSLDDWDGAATTVFRAWATRLKEIGVTAVNGRIIGDDNVFADEGLGAGWAWDDLAFAYSAAASGLQFNEGAAQVVVTPGAQVGAQAVLAVSPAYAAVPLRGFVRTEKAGVPASLALEQLPRSAGVRLTGSVPIDGTPQIRNVSVDNPTLYFVNAVRAGLQANGIEIRGDAVDADDIVGAPVVEGTPAVMVHRSPALSSLADTLMKLSQNLYAETLLRTIGRVRSGVGTADAGRAAVRDVLASWGVPAGDVLVADGSGLSRYNLVTTDAMVSILLHVYADPRLRDPYLASLPVAGRAGTLAARMQGTAAEGNVRAKTGSFTNARAVAGFVQTAEGEPLAFSIIANNYGGPPTEVDRVTDAILVALAEFRR